MATKAIPARCRFPLNAPIEGYPVPGNGDRHVLVLDNSNCWLYELYSSYPDTARWNAGSAAVWDLTADEQRPYTWTSADAAGLPIFPGLVRYDEVAAGADQPRVAVHAAIEPRRVRAARVALGREFDECPGRADGHAHAPQGQLRYLAFSAANQVILNALKKYGMIMADNGSSMYISGAPDDRWDNNDLHNLGNITASDFEVVQMNPIYTAANVPTGANPAITSFNASSQSVSAGSARHAELERHRRVPFDRFARCRRGARKQRGGHTRPVHHLHAVRHQCVRTHYGHNQYYGALICFVR